MTIRARLWCIALALVLFGLTACGGDSAAPTPPPDSPTPQGNSGQISGGGTQVAIAPPTPTITPESYDVAPVMPTSTVLPVQAIPAARGATVTPSSRTGKPRTPRAAVTPVPGTVPTNLCLYRDLDIRAYGYVSTTGGLTTGVFITNVGGSVRSDGSCLLKGFPTSVQILDGNNKVLAFGAINDPDYYPDTPIDPFNVLRLKATGIGFIDWQNWCGPGIQLPMKVRYALPGNGLRTQVINDPATDTPFLKPPTRQTCDDDPASKFYVGPLVVLSGSATR